MGFFFVFSLEHCVVLSGRSACLFTVKMVAMEHIMSCKVLPAALHIMAKLVEIWHSE